MLSHCITFSLGEATVAQTLQDLEVNLHTIHDIGRAADCLLNLLDLAQGHPESLALGVEMGESMIKTGHLLLINTKIFLFMQLI